MSRNQLIPFGAACFGVIIYRRSQRRRDEAKYAEHYGCLAELNHDAKRVVYEDLRDYHTSIWRPVFTSAPYHLSEVFAQQKSFSIFDRSSPIISANFCRLNGFDPGITPGDEDDGLDDY